MLSVEKLSSLELCHSEQTTNFSERLR